MARASLDHVHKIVIRSANWVGDAIMTTPAVAAIRDNFPQAHITMLAKPWVMAVFAHNPHIDDLMVYDAKERHRGAIGVLRLARDVSRRRFDLAILFQNAFEAALIAWLAGVPRRLGYTTDVRSLLLTDRIRSWPQLKKGHLVYYYLGILTGAGLRVAPPQLELFLSDAEQRQAVKMLHLSRDVPPRTIVGLNPGATYGTAKRWPSDRFVALAKRLIRDDRCRILIFGGPGEAQLGAQIADQIGPGSENLCNRTTLRDAMALIGCCDGFVTNDSGLMHVAAALKIPQVAIIGPTDPVATGPLSSESRMVQNPGSCDCAPCLKPHCTTDHRCMTSIDVDQVYDALKECMAKRGAP